MINISAELVQRTELAPKETTLIKDPIELRKLNWKFCAIYFTYFVCTFLYKYNCNIVICKHYLSYYCKHLFRTLISVD